MTKLAGAVYHGHVGHDELGLVGSVVLQYTKRIDPHTGTAPHPPSSAVTRTASRIVAATEASDMYRTRRLETRSRDSLAKSGCDVLPPPRCSSVQTHVKASSLSPSTWTTHFFWTSTGRIHDELIFLRASPHGLMPVLGIAHALPKSETIDSPRAGRPNPTSERLLAAILLEALRSHSRKFRTRSATPGSTSGRTELA